MAASTGGDYENAATGTSRVTPWLPVLFVALSHLGLLLVVSDVSSLALLVAVEGGLLALAGGSEWLYSRSRTTLVALGVAWPVLVAWTWLVLQWTASVLWTALALASGLALAAYFLHRYELVALGLVEVDDE